MKWFFLLPRVCRCIQLHNGWIWVSFILSFIHSIDRSINRERENKTDTFYHHHHQRNHNQLSHTHVIVNLVFNCRGFHYMIWWKENGRISVQFFHVLLSFFFFIWNDTTFLNSQKKTKQKKIRISNVNMHSHYHFFSFEWTNQSISSILISFSLSASPSRISEIKIIFIVTFSHTHTLQTNKNILKSI